MKKLHKLIHSMSSAERRHFKLYIKTNNIQPQPKYLSLFNALSKVESFNEIEFAKNRFSYSDKNLLWKKLMEALHIFHNRKSVDAEIQLLLSHASILYEKNIWDEMDKQLQKAKKLAIKNERLLLLLQIIQLRKNAAFARVDSLSFEALNGEQSDVLERFLEETNYEYKREKVLEIRNSISLTKTEKLEQLAALSSPPMLPDLSASSTALSKIHYYAANFIYREFIEDEQRISDAEKILEICQNSTFLSNLNRVASTYAYMFSYLNRVNGRKMGLIDIFDNLPIKNKNILYFICGYDLQDCINYYLDKTKGEAIIHTITTNNYINKVHSHKQIRLVYLIMEFYGTFEDWEKADIWFKRLSSIKRPNIQRFVQVRSRIYSLAIGYEVDEKDLDIHIQSVQKYLKRNNVYSKLERNILEIFNKLYEAYQHHDRVKIWKELYDLLQTSARQVHIPSVELKRWCKSKIDGITIAEAIRREQKKRDV